MNLNKGRWNEHRPFAINEKDTILWYHNIQENFFTFYAMKPHFLRVDR